jgi:hypothetical protein
MKKKKKKKKPKKLQSMIPLAPRPKGSPGAGME